MKLNKALKILGLNKNYTEKELRKAYVKLMKKYHPDSLVGKSEKEQKIALQKAQEIINAHEFLDKKIKEDKKMEAEKKEYERKIIFGRKFNLTTRLIDKLEELESIDSSYEEMLNNTKTGLIKYLIDKIKQVNDIEAISALEELDFEVTQYMKSVGIEYKRMYVESKGKFSIRNLETLQTVINSGSLKKIHSFLESCYREKLTRIFNTEIEKYLYWDFYQIIENSIERTKKYYIDNIIHNKINLVCSIDEFNYRINRLFEKLYERLDKFSKYNEQYKFYSVKVEKYLYSMKCSLDDEIKFNLLAEKLEETVDNYKTSKFARRLAYNKRKELNSNSQKKKY